MGRVLNWPLLGGRTALSSQARAKSDQYAEAARTAIGDANNGLGARLAREYETEARVLEQLEELEEIHARASALARLEAVRE